MHYGANPAFIQQADALPRSQCVCESQAAWQASYICHMQYTPACDTHIYQPDRAHTWGQQMRRCSVQIAAACAAPRLPTTPIHISVVETLSKNQINTDTALLDGVHRQAAFATVGRAHQQLGLPPSQGCQRIHCLWRMTCSTQPTFRQFAGQCW